ncbi:hypothetical protein GOBAR_DD32980 [Gossypium barbadense]|nr:hypothetical protein GOBAR_DD32980 [Gossypium barbadense]
MALGANLESVAKGRLVKFGSWRPDTPLIYGAFPSWFYTLMVLSIALLGAPAFRNLICSGLVLAEDGKKMSKRLKNYPSPMKSLMTTGLELVVVQPNEDFLDDIAGKLREEIGNLLKAYRSGFIIGEIYVD